MGVDTAKQIPKSQPDVGKLNGFSGHTVTVTRHPSARGSVGTAVVPTQPMPLKQILDLAVTLPPVHGPGFYFFNVTDTGGTQEDTWLVRLGPDTQEGFSMPGPQSPFPPGGVNAPLSEGVRNLGRGYTYDEQMHLLSTPWGELIEWQPGQPLPKPPTSATSHLQIVPPGAQPGQWPPGSGWNTGWGGYPVNEDSATVKRLEAEAVESRRRAEREEDRRAQERREEEQRRRDEERERRAEANQRDVLKLFEALAAKPTGPTEADRRIEQMERQAADEKRAREEMEREHRRQEETRRLEDQRREEMRLMKDQMERVAREATANKADPMLALFGTILSTQAATSAETARMIRETGEAARLSSERSSSQIIELARGQRDGAAEAARASMEVMKDTMGVTRDVYTQMLELSGNNNAPWYAGAIQGAIEKAGTVAQAIAAKSEQQAQQPQYIAPPRQAPRPVGPATTRPIPQTQAAPPLPAATAPIAPGDTGERPEGVEYSAETDEFLIPGGYRVKKDYVQQHGWNVTLKMLARQRTPSPVVPEAVEVIAPKAGPVVGEMHGAGVNGVGANGAAPKRGKGRGKSAPAAPPPPPPSAAYPPPANPAKGYTREELEALEPEQMLAIVAPFDDPTFFGNVLWPYVQQLRANQVAPAEVAKYVLQGASQLATSGTAVPATDVLHAGQLDALVERLFPDGPEDYAEAIVAELAKAMGLSVIEDGDGEGAEA